MPSVRVTLVTTLGLADTVTPQITRSVKMTSATVITARLFRLGDVRRGLVGPLGDTRPGLTAGRLPADASARPALALPVGVLPVAVRVGAVGVLSVLGEILVSAPPVVVLVPVPPVPVLRWNLDVRHAVF
jgi:hypothetical protein